MPSTGPASTPVAAVNQRTRELLPLSLDKDRRLALMRYHTVLHVLNTIVLCGYAGWITGVQIGTDYSRIDFKLEGFSPALVPELEDKVNTVLSENHNLKASTIPEEEFRQRDGLLRTLKARSLVSHGLVRKEPENKGRVLRTRPLFSGFYHSTA